MMPAARRSFSGLEPWTRCANAIATDSLSFSSAQRRPNPLSRRPFMWPPVHLAVTPRRQEPRVGRHDNNGVARANSGLHYWFVEKPGVVLSLWPGVARLGRSPVCERSEPN